MTLDIAVATLGQPGAHDSIASWKRTARTPIHPLLCHGLTIIEAYQKCYEQMRKDAEVLGFLHDDLMIFEENWDLRVLRQFEDPKVGVVGFGGAYGHGHPYLYKGEFQIPLLARQGFISNMKSAEQHGTRFTGDTDVAILDGFALFIRRACLDQIGGWAGHGPISYYLYAEMACAEARRRGWKIRMCGVKCEHKGGASSGMKQDQVFDFEGEHRYLYETYKESLPWDVRKGGKI